MCLPLEGYMSKHIFICLDPVSVYLDRKVGVMLYSERL